MTMLFYYNFTSNNHHMIEVTRSWQRMSNQCLIFVQCSIFVYLIKTSKLVESQALFWSSVHICTHECTCMYRKKINVWTYVPTCDVSKFVGRYMWYEHMYVSTCMHQSMYVCVYLCIPFGTTAALSLKSRQGHELRSAGDDLLHQVQHPSVWKCYWPDQIQISLSCNNKLLI